MADCAVEDDLALAADADLDRRVNPAAVEVGGRLPDPLDAVIGHAAVGRRRFGADRRHRLEVGGDPRAAQQVGDEREAGNGDHRSSLNLAQSGGADATGAPGAASGDNRHVTSRAALVAGALGIALLAAPQTALAGPLGLSDCGQTEGVYQCSGLVETWDGIPLDTTVTLPEQGAGELPLVADVHGFGNSKYEYLDPASQAYTGNAFSWAKRGYAVLTYTARGLWGSCGTPESRLASPIACADGYIHLADVRYEVRDTQELIGRLVDEGVADANAIGVTGDSYGGGQSLMLAALRDRVMQPDGTLVPWRSPSGQRLSLAAAAPVIPWTDLVSAAAPNGQVSATGITSRADGDRPGRGREGDRRQRDLRGGRVRDRPRTADRRAVHPRAPDGVSWRRRAPTRMPTSRAGSRAPTRASPTTTRPRRRSSRSSSASTRPTTSTRATRRRRCCSVRASPMTSSRSTR